MEQGAPRSQGRRPDGETGNSGILIPEIFFEKTLDKSSSRCYTIIRKREEQNPEQKKENEL